MFRRREKCRKNYFVSGAGAPRDRVSLEAVVDMPEPPMPEEEHDEVEA